ncbi:DegT/DnrJ/EryC1/StrS family aminotransferase [Dongshaea marina]|uniref:DegT/DnrJ/EryC1/StrS family aminotransferase n=1 Tax=Dongshaea marina TaxID=2047966 RepID=UPI000D3EAF84|nr:DegT/DnrJ/EryC1/StrS family aminotransferase [Dongshaea marina]
MIPLVKVGMPDKKILMSELEKVLYSGMIAEGEKVYDFEYQFSKMFGLSNAIAMSSGTAALHASLILSGVSPGDEVITTSMTAEPTNISILHVGAVPVFADVDPLSGNLSPSSIRKKISSKTKAIIVVHYAGIPARMSEIMKISKEFNIPVIEDCAHSLGAQYDNKGIGTIGDFGIFSFQAIKHMTTVDGGFLVMKDKHLINKAKRFRWFGLEKGIPRSELNISDIGYKYNMTNVTAVIGLSQLSAIESRIARHKENGYFFDSNIPQVSGLTVPKFEKCAIPSYWLYTIFSDDYQNVQKCLNDIGVSASKLHKPNHLHSIFNASDIPLPNLDYYYKRMIHIPCGWWVKEEDRENILDALKKG